jgi:hypothetical protein
LILIFILFVQKSSWAAKKRVTSTAITTQNLRPYLPLPRESRIPTPPPLMKLQPRDTEDDDGQRPPLTKNGLGENQHRPTQPPPAPETRRHQHQPKRKSGRKE